VLAGLVFIMSAGKGTVVARPGRDSLRPPWPTIINIVVFSFPYPLNILVKTKDHPGLESLDHRDSPDMRPAACYINIMPASPSGLMANTLSECRTAQMTSSDPI